MHQQSLLCPIYLDHLTTLLDLDIHVDKLGLCTSVQIKPLIISNTDIFPAVINQMFHIFYQANHDYAIIPVTFSTSPLTLPPTFIFSNYRFTAHLPLNQHLPSLSSFLEAYTQRSPHPLSDHSSRNPLPCPLIHLPPSSQPPSTPYQG